VEGESGQEAADEGVLRLDDEAIDSNGRAHRAHARIVGEPVAADAAACLGPTSADRVRFLTT
jgi:hypothetical protein